jgi:hypothetical protein
MIKREAKNLSDISNTTKFKREAYDYSATKETLDIANFLKSLKF